MTHSAAWLLQGIERWNACNRRPKKQKRAVGALDLSVCRLPSAALSDGASVNHIRHRLFPSGVARNDVLSHAELGQRRLEHGIGISSTVSAGALDCRVPRVTAVCAYFGVPSTCYTT